MRYKNF